MIYLCFAFSFFNLFAFFWFWWAYIHCVAVFLFVYIVIYIYSFILIRFLLYFYYFVFVFKSCHTSFRFIWVFVPINCFISGILLYIHVLRPMSCLGEFAGNMECEVFLFCISLCLLEGAVQFPLYLIYDMYIDYNIFCYRSHWFHHCIHTIFFFLKNLRLYLWYSPIFIFQFATSWFCSFCLILCWGLRAL